MLSLVTMKKTKPMKIQAIPACAKRTIRPRNNQNMGVESLPKYLYLLMTFARPSDQPNRQGEWSWAQTEGEHIKLLFTSTACGVDREEDRPGDAAANKGDDHAYLQEAEEKVGIERVVLQDVSIGDLNIAF
jgi:hypothetical protein